jgi:solute carrier family 25 S-adenosylmethionine transporter 26
MKLYSERGRNPDSTFGFTSDRCSFRKIMARTSEYDDFMNEDDVIAVCAALITATSPGTGGVYHGAPEAKRSGLVAFERLGSTLWTNRVSLAASAVARAASTVVMFPLDTLKTRLQSADTAALGPREALRKVLTQGHFYRGLGSTLFGQVPYGALTFGTYECYKQALEEWGLASRRLRWMLAAVLGDLTGSLWLTPSELIKQQLQNMHNTGTRAAQAATVWQVIGQNWRQYGIAGFYRGYSGQVARDVPFRAIQLLLFEDARERLERYRRRALTPLENLAVGAYAGCLTAAVTTPLDVIKTRLMTDRTYRHAGDALWQLLRTQPRALFRGIVPRVLYIAPSSAIFFIVYTFLQRRWDAKAAAWEKRGRDASCTPTKRNWGGSRFCAVDSKFSGRKPFSLARSMGLCA